MQLNCSGDNRVLQIDRSRPETTARADSTSQEERRKAWFPCLINVFLYFRYTRARLYSWLSVNCSLNLIWIHTLVLIILAHLQFLMHISSFYVSNVHLKWLASYKNDFLDNRNPQILVQNLIFRGTMNEMHQLKESTDTDLNCFVK